MSLDRSLKSANALVRHRNVLTRAERLDVLAEQEKWNDQKPVFGLPKVAHRKMAVAKAVKEETAEGAAGAVAGAAAPAAGAAPAKGAAAPAKGATPAKGAAPAKGAPAGKAAAGAAAPGAKGKK
jgi:small basic protein (TIGR04137 family)